MRFLPTILAGSLLALAGCASPAAPAEPVAVRPVSVQRVEQATRDAQASNQTAAQEIARALRILEGSEK